MNKLPFQYSYLLKDGMPRVITEAIALYGTIEYKGDANNITITNWAKELGNKVGISYGEDSIPWCGLFVGVCVKRANQELPSILIRAKSWINFGNPVIDYSIGDVLVFQRTGGGHVGFYVGEDKDCFHVLGGNQSDSVNITRIRKDRLVGARRCKWKVAQPYGVRPMHLTATGAISQNES